MNQTNLPKMPDLKVFKNGYEVRTEILQLAKNLVDQDFHWKYLGWETSVVKDNNGNIVTKVAMPEYPGLEKILETAEKMYNFVCHTKK